MTQPALAELAGVSVRMVQEVERGTRSYGAENAAAVADALNLSKVERAQLMAAVKTTPSKDLQRRHDELAIEVARLSKEVARMQDQIAALLGGGEKRRDGQG